MGCSKARGHGAKRGGPPGYGAKFLTSAHTNQSGAIELVLRPSPCTRPMHPPQFEMLFCCEIRHLQVGDHEIAILSLATPYYRVHSTRLAGVSRASEAALQQPEPVRQIQNKVISRQEVAFGEMTKSCGQLYRARCQHEHKNKTQLTTAVVMRSSSIATPHLLRSMPSDICRGTWPCQGRTIHEGKNG